LEGFKPIKTCFYLLTSSGYERRATRLLHPASKLSAPFLEPWQWAFKPC